MLRSGKQPFLRRKALCDDSGSGCVGDYVIMGYDGQQNKEGSRKQ